MAVKFTKRDIISLSDKDVLGFGPNLFGCEGLEAHELGTGETPKMKAGGQFNEDALCHVVDEKYRCSHIDIFGKSTEFVFKKAYNYAPETVIITSFFHDSIDYTMDEFTVFASDNRDDLFDSSNEVAHEKSHWTAGNRNNSDYVYDVEGDFTYLGLRVLKSNPTDDILRLRDVCALNEKFTYNSEYLKKHYNPSLLAGMEPSAITNGIIFDDNYALEIKGEKTFDFPLASSRKLTHLWVVTKGDAEIECDALKDAIVTCESLEADRKCYTFSGMSDNISVLSVKVKGDVLVDQIGAFSAICTAEIDFNNVITEDYIGIGANSLPMSFMEENMATGYNEVYWELEKSRIAKADPHVIRFWFQPDWLVENYEQYKNGEYNFDSEKMYSVKKYLDIYNELDIDVEFDFGWKVSTFAQEWFSFPNARLLRNSAPREVDLFAKCCATTLKELIVERGYKCIKYLTYYNEPDYGKHSLDHGDFVVDGCKRTVYWEKILRATLSEMDKLGIKDIVKVWGFEQSGSIETQTEWMDYLGENMTDVMDMHSFHLYNTNESQAYNFISKLNEHRHKKPIIMTEYGVVYNPDAYKWDFSHVALFMTSTNLGVSGMVTWVLNSIYITDPCSFMMRNVIDYWDTPQMPYGIDNVRDIYYEMTPIARYVPKHAKCVKSTVIDDKNSLRCASFKTDDGNYTVIAEVNRAKCDRNIEISLGKNIGKKFYKYIYRRPTCRTGNAIFAPCFGSLDVADKIIDTVTEDYQMVIYSTLPPIPQIRTSASELHLERGVSTRITAEIVDGSGDVAFSMAKKIGNGFKFDTNGVIGADESAEIGDMCAIKVSSVNNPKIFDIVIAKVVK